MSEKKQFGPDWAWLVYQGFIKIWRVVNYNWEIVEKKDAVAILIYNRDRRQVIFVRQYRPAVGHTIAEAIAGHIEENHSAGIYPMYWVKMTMAREVEEEVGAKVDPNQIELFENGAIYSSPGFTTEKIWLGYLEIGDADIETQERVFGLQAEGEQIQRLWVDIKDLPNLADHEFYDMKTLVLVNWFLRKKYPRLMDQKG